MSLPIGTKLGSYEIVAPLGAGGMGEVYRAWDAKLAREVALKVLPEPFATDADRLTRFEREARTLAALNHPHIAHVYGFENRALVMELVEGEDLAQRITRGPIPIDEVLAMAQQIAEGLEAAHDLGIIHRDLKPANIKVRSDGTVKILDFGLAKALDDSALPGRPGGSGRSGAGAPEQLNSPTITSPAALTMGGMILGTAAYMAPEQAKGKPVDKRADIWAFGCVVFEMLTAQRAFDGEDVTETIVAVMTRVPEWSALPPATPAYVRLLLSRCLTKDPRLRLRDIGEARIAVTGQTGDSAALGDAFPPSTRKARWPVAASALGGLLFGALLMLVARPPVAPAPERYPNKFELVVEDLSMGEDTPAALSPDGRRLAYIGTRGLWVRELASLQARLLQGTAGARAPMWSPDSASLAYLRGVQLWKIGASGGDPTPVAKLPDEACGAPTGAWEASGRILWSMACGVHPLLGVSAQGGELAAVLEPDARERDFHGLAVLPESRGVLFVVCRRDGPCGDTVDVWTVNGRTRVLQLAGERLASPVYSPSGHVLFERRGKNEGIWAIRFSLDRLQADGEPFLVAGGMGQPSVAADGTLVFASQFRTGLYQLTWLDPTGRGVGTVGAPGERQVLPRLSPDGSRIAFEEPNAGVWVLDVARGFKTRLTLGPAGVTRPAWSGDGSRVYYELEKPGGRPTIASTNVASPGSSEPVVEGTGPAALSRDGRWLVYAVQNEKTDTDLWRKSLPDGPMVPFVQESGRQSFPALSPDGRLLAYLSADVGKTRLLVRTFPEGSGVWQLTENGAQHPHWNLRGDKLYYAWFNVMHEVDVTPAPDPTFGPPRVLFRGPELRVFPSFNGFTVAADGRFLVSRQTERKMQPSVFVVQNWFAEFEQKQAERGSR